MKLFFVNGRINQFTIRKQLYIIYFPIIFLSILIIGLLLVVDSTLKLEENYKNLSALNAQRVKSTLFDLTNNLNKNAESLANDTVLRDLLSTTYASSLEAQTALATYERGTQLLNQETALYSLNIYTTNDSISTYKQFVPVDDAIKSKPWFQKALITPEFFWWTNQDAAESDERKLNLTLYKHLPLPLSDYQAVIEMKIDYNFLKNRLATPNYFVQLHLNDDALFYSDARMELGQKATFLAPSQAEFFHYERFMGDELVGSNTLNLNNDNDRLYVYSIDDSSYGILRSNLLKWTSILLVVLATTTVIIVTFANFFSHRIHDLQNAVHHASIEDYDYLVNVSGQDEISRIFIDFHTVIQNVIAKDEAVYHAQLLEKELTNEQQQMEFKVLANQINPHFLYNTLETIRMLALNQGNREVARAIQLLAKSMRYTLETAGLNKTTLQSSLDYVEVYLNIQKLRFGDRVNYLLNVDPDLDTQKIDTLPLLIQPIVENAIAHGLEKIKQKGYITILIYRQTARLLIIEVSDTGNGMSPEKLAEIRTLITTSSIASYQNIGLRNVHSRIRLHYGEKSGLSIDSVPDKGTTVKLTLDLPEDL